MLYISGVNFKSLGDSLLEISRSQQNPGNMPCDLGIWIKVTEFQTFPRS